MSSLSKIEWTDATWNPVRGCTKISPGCKHCYAGRFAERFRGVEGHPFGQGFDLRLVPEKLGEPLRWSEPKMIFVNSMSDLFHPDVPDSFIVQVAETMRIASWHITKRPERLKRMLNGPLRQAAEEKHIWWGGAVENRKHGVPRIAYLQETPAAVRFLSVEPLLENVGILPLEGISWVIVGGESGPGARPMEESWVISIQKQRKAAGVPFFFKQWGGVRKKVHGRTLRGFDSARQLMGYCGAVPSEDSSGKRTRRGSITKMDASASSARAKSGTRDQYGLYLFLSAVPLNIHLGLGKPLDQKFTDELSGLG